MVKSKRIYIVVLSMLVLASCASMKSDWEKTMSENTITAYEVFVQKYPEGEFTQEARNRIEELEWQTAQTTDTVGAYETFLQKYPQGMFVQEARNRIEERLEWQTAQTTDTVGAYETFLQKYPEGMFVQEARNRIRDIITQNLLRTIEEGDLDSVKKATNFGVDIDAKLDKYGNTALTWAAIKGKIEIVKFLLDSGADIHVTTTDGETVLIRAIRNNRSEIAKLLIGAGADANTTDKDGQTALMDAANKGDIETVKLLLDRGADVNAKNSDGWTALMVTASIGNFEITKFLLDNDVEINAQDKDGYTALMRAVSDMELDIVKLLLEHGADVNARDQFMHTPLFNALDESFFRNSEKIVIQLLEHGADVNARDQFGRTPLFNALDKPIFMDHEKIVIQLLIDYGADVNARDQLGRTPLLNMLSREEGDYIDDDDPDYSEITKLMIQNGADLNVQDEDGLTPLMFAIIHDRELVASVLINYGADISIENKKGDTAEKIVNSLYSPERNIFKMTKQYDLSKYELCVAIMHNDKEILQKILTDEKPEEPLDAGRALMLAVGRNNLEYVKLLLNNTKKYPKNEEGFFDASNWAENRYYNKDESYMEILKFMTEKWQDLVLGRIYENGFYAMKPIKIDDPAVVQYKTYLEAGALSDEGNRNEVVDLDLEANRALEVAAANLSLEQYLNFFDLLANEYGYIVKKDTHKYFNEESHISMGGTLDWRFLCLNVDINMATSLIEQYPHVKMKNFYDINFPKDTREYQRAVANLKKLGIYDKVCQDRANIMVSNLLGKTFDDKTNRGIVQIIDGTSYKDVYITADALLARQRNFLKKDNYFQKKADKILVQPEVKNNIHCLNNLSLSDLAIIFGRIGFASTDLYTDAFGESRRILGHLIRTKIAIQLDIAKDKDIHRFFNQENTEAPINRFLTYCITSLNPDSISEESVLALMQNFEFGYRAIVFPTATPYIKKFLGNTELSGITTNFLESIASSYPDTIPDELFPAIIHDPFGTSSTQDQPIDDMRARANIIYNSLVVKDINLDVTKGLQSSDADVRLRALIVLEKMDTGSRKSNLSTETIKLLIQNLADHTEYTIVDNHQHIEHPHLSATKLFSPYSLSRSILQFSLNVDTDVRKMLEKAATSTNKAISEAAKEILDSNNRIFWPWL